MTKDAEIPKIVNEYSRQTVIWVNLFKRRSYSKFKTRPGFKEIKRNILIKGTLPST